MKLNSIKFMATATILTVGLATISIFSIFSYMNTKATLETRYFNESELVLEHTLLDIQSIFTHASRFIGQLAQEKVVQNADMLSGPNNMNVLFQLLQSALPGSRAIKLGLENGVVFHGPIIVNMPLGYDPRALPWYALAKQQEGKTVWTEPYLDYIDQKIIITAAQSVEKTMGTISGVLAVDYELVSISSAISAAHIGTRGYLMLLNQSGTVIANTNNYWIGEHILGNDFERIRDSAMKQQTEFILKGEPYYIKAGKLQGNGMLVITAISKQEITDSLWTVQFPILISGVICLALFGIIAYYYALRGIAPLERLAALMKSAEHGNYEVEASMNNYDEIQSLGKGFNNMIEAIKKRDEALHASNQQIFHMAYYDNLTGLLNRQNLVETIDKAIENESQTPMALIFIDLDNFKTINDTMGHSTGDRLLVEVGKRLQSISYAYKEVARIGGDEFIMVLHDAEFAVIIDGIMKEILAALNAPVRIGIESYQTTASLGVAFYPEHGAHLKDLMKNADIAMYGAKAKGKNQYSIYNG